MGSSIRRRETPKSALKKRLDGVELKAFEDLTTLAESRAAAYDLLSDEQKKRVNAALTARRKPKGAGQKSPPPKLDDDEKRIADELERITRQREELHGELTPTQRRNIGRELIEERSRFDDPLTRQTRGRKGRMLRELRQEERAGKHHLPYIMRGIDEYNGVHGVDFRSVVDDLGRQFPEDTIKVLDVGCGRGQFLKEIRDDFGDAVDVQGITLTTQFRLKEPPDAQIGPVLPTGREGNIHTGHGENIRFPADHFHLVVSTATAMYAGDAQRMADEMFRVVKPGGRMYLDELASVDDFKSRHPNADVRKLPLRKRGPKALFTRVPVEICKSEMPVQEK